MTAKGRNHGQLIRRHENKLNPFVKSLVSDLCSLWTLKEMDVFVNAHENLKGHETEGCKKW